MMTVGQLSEQPDFEIISQIDPHRAITGVYCCDLLSIVMGRAPAGCAWVTVMGNLNALGVASLVEAACIVLAEGMTLDAPTAAKAKEEGIAVLRTTLPVFAAARMIDQQLG